MSLSGAAPTVTVALPRSFTFPAYRHYCLCQESEALVRCLSGVAWSYSNTLLQLPQVPVSWGFTLSLGDSSGCLSRAVPCLLHPTLRHLRPISKSNPCDLPHTAVAASRPQYGSRWRARHVRVAREGKSYTDDPSSGIAARFYGRSEASARPSRAACKPF